MDRSLYGQVATCPYKTTQKHTMKNRKPNRHPFWNYSSDGAYFVTICTKNREHFFGEISGGKMVLNNVGKIVAQQWQWLESQYHHVLLDEWVVMPNHFHGIICIVNNDPVVAGRDVGTGRELSLPKPCKPPKPIPQLIGAFKTTSSKRIHRETKFLDFAWQRSYHDHIIRDEKSLENIRNYVQQNPALWHRDRNNNFGVWM